MKKRIALLSFLIGIVAAPIQAQAQQSIPTLSDCALRLAAFKITVVTGVDQYVPDETFQFWRNHFVTNYPILSPLDKLKLANACAELSNLTARWPYMSAAERQVSRLMWSTLLPQVVAQQNAAPNGVQNGNPVEEYNTQQAITQTTRCVTFPQNYNPEAEVRYLTSHPGARVCPSPNPNLAGQAGSLNSFNNWMTNWTINQMH